VQYCKDYGLVNRTLHWVQHECAGQANRICIDVFA
jgi:hypothetical protein